jgi:peptidoglycan hydrolase-like protein with peptidoglycan-binding domain
MPKSGEWVRYLQELLERAGYWGEVRTDQLDPSLVAAVERFQSDRGLPTTGEPDGATWLALGQLTEDERVPQIDLRGDFPEIYQVATASDLDDYLGRVVEIDPADFGDESAALEEQPPEETASPEFEEEAE